MPNINLRNYNISAFITETETHEKLTENSSQCQQIKTISVRPDSDVPVINGSWYDYSVEVSNKNVRVKPRLNRLKQIILTLFCVPFAIWFVQGTFADASSMLLPLGALFLSFGIVFTIGYSLGAKEQKAILPFIYQTLKGESAGENTTIAMTASFVSTVIPCILGVIALVVHFSTS